MIYGRWMGHLLLGCPSPGCPNPCCPSGWPSPGMGRSGLIPAPPTRGPVGVLGATGTACVCCCCCCCAASSCCWAAISSWRDTVDDQLLNRGYDTCCCLANCCCCCWIWAIMAAILDMKLLKGIPVTYDSCVGWDRPELQSVEQQTAVRESAAAVEDTEERLQQMQQAAALEGAETRLLPRSDCPQEVRDGDHEVDRDTQWLIPEGNCESGVRWISNSGSLTMWRGWGGGAALWGGGGLAHGE